MHLIGVQTTPMGKLQLGGIGAASDRERAAAAVQAIPWVLSLSMGESDRYLAETRPKS
jgi:hypothetical protein